jgi:quercetin dioxygenase-like cupin family protein
VIVNAWRFITVACVASVAFQASAQAPASGKSPTVRPAHSLVIPGDSSRAISSNVSARIRSMLDTATTTLERLEVHQTSLAPGGSPHPPHRHAHDEMMLVERGILEVTQEGVMKKAGPGSLIFQSSNELHGLKNVGADTAVYWVIAIYPRDLADSSRHRR